MGVTSREGEKSRTEDEMGDARGVINGVCLGGVGVRRGDGAAMSLVGSAGTGSTRSTQGVGVVAGMGGARGVVTVEVLPSTYTDFTTEGGGTNKFICPWVSERGGTEIQSSSVSFGAFGVMMG